MVVHPVIGFQASDLEDIFKSASYVDLPNQRSTGMLIHINPVNHGPRRFEARFATQYIMQALAERF